jgi:hypothetical protein
MNGDAELYAAGYVQPTQPIGHGQSTQSAGDVPSRLPVTEVSPATSTVGIFSTRRSQGGPVHSARTPNVTEISSMELRAIIADIMHEGEGKHGRASEAEAEAAVRKLLTAGHP